MNKGSGVDGMYSTQITIYFYKVRMGRHIFSTQCQCWQMWEFQSFKKTYYQLCRYMYCTHTLSKSDSYFLFWFRFHFSNNQKKKMWKRNSKSQKHCKIICEIIVPPPNIFTQFYKSSSMLAVCVMWWEPHPMNFPRSCIIAKKSHMILQNKFKLSL